MKKKNKSIKIAITTAFIYMVTYIINGNDIGNALIIALLTLIYFEIPRK